MLTIDTPQEECVPEWSETVVIESQEQEEQLSFTDLQPLSVTEADMAASMISSSTDPCLGMFPDEGFSVEYVIQTDELDACAVYNLPDSPLSLVEDDCSLAEESLLQTRLYEDSQVYEDQDDDDASVMLDLMDLSFLDDEVMDSGEGSPEELDYGHCFTDSLDTCHTVVVSGATGENSSDCRNHYLHFTPFPFPPTPSPSPTSCSPINLYNQPSSSSPLPLTMTPPSPSSSSSTFPFYFYDQATSISSPTTIIFNPSPPPLTNNSSSNTIVPLSPTSSNASSSSEESRLQNKRKRSQQQKQQPKKQKQRDEEQVSDDLRDDAAILQDFDAFDNSDGDDYDDDFKPYCGSRRGAKKNLLWKFLLWTLDHHTDVVSWTDVRRGIFKFKDTNRVSTLWGQRKKKRGMNFEKLSRGIRHYYKRGLMERMPKSRLMYKFNWEMVPKKYRKV